MKKSVTLFLFFLSVLSLTAQDAAIDEKKKKKAESKLEFIRKEHESGAYEEAMDHARKFTRNLQGVDYLIAELTEAKLIQARSLNALFRFKEAEEAFKEAAELSKKSGNSGNALRTQLSIANYLQETGDLTGAEKYLESASALSQASVNEKEKADFNFMKALLLLKQGYYTQALLLADQQVAYRLQMASASLVDAKDKEALTEKIDYVKRKEKYASILNLKASALLNQGQYKEAETAIKNTQSWTADQLGKSHSLYREAIRNEAKLALIKNNPGKASTLFIDAYTAQNFPESEEHKIINLTDAIITSIQSDQIIRVNNYLRRSQMYAFRSVGPYDPFQIAYEYAMSYKLFHEGNFSSSLSRLEKVSDNFNFLPAVNYWHIAVMELKAKVALKSGNIKLYKETISKISEISEKYYGNNTPVYHRLRLALAIYEINFGTDFALAESIMQKSYTGVVKKEISPTSSENIDFLTAYAELFHKKDQYDSAAAKAKEAMEASLQIHGEKSAEYAWHLAVFTEFQILSGKYKEGFENLQKATTLAQNTKEGALDIRQDALLILARLYTTIGEFEKSQTLLNQAYRLNLAGDEQQLLAEAETFEQLGSLNLLSGNYYKAEKSLNIALDLKENSLSADNPLLIHIYQELARLYITTGNYNNADLYLKMAIKIAETSFSNKSLRFAECLLISADYYLAIGDYKKAEDACLKADNITIEKLGKSNLQRAEILSELAFIRFKMGTHKSADIENTYKEANNIIKNSLGANNPLSALLSQKEAELFISTGAPQKAEPLLAEAEKFWTSKLGTDNQHSAQIQVLRGDILYSSNKFDLAEKSYKKAQQIYANVFTDKHPSYIKASGKLARVYYMNKDVQRSLETMEDIIPKYLEYTANYFPSLSFREKSKFWNNMKEEFEFYNFIAFKLNSKNPKLSEKVYNNLISTKALLLSSNLKIRESILASKDTVLIDYYNEWIAEKEYLTTIVSFTKQQLAEQKIDPKAIEDDVEFLEKEISKRSEVFSGEESKKRASWNDIKKTLKDNEYAVEIVRYRSFHKSFTDTILYAALIISNKSEIPEVVQLPDGNLMEKKNLKIYRNSIIYKLADKESYNLYWKPLGSKIPEGATVYFSADGVYNQMNVETLNDESGKYVLDKYQVVLVTNSKDLLNKSVVSTSKKDKKKDSQKASEESKYLLCGNPDFYSEASGGHIASLPGAEQEINEINKVLVNNNKKTVKFLNEFVTEDTLKSFQSPAVFHIATHGYFKEGVDSDEEDFASNPLLNSGLLLYGSGDILSNTENSYVNHKDGILTAYEATNLNFDNTELVVLSACETGRGEVQVGEGVYGLQRAFLIAGADAVVMSLFKVDDAVTQKLMLTFYNNWLKSGNKRTAFIEAKREIKKEFNSPIFWGAFIMIEGKPSHINSSEAR